MKLPLGPALLCCTPGAPGWLWQFCLFSRNLEDAGKHLLTGPSEALVPFGAVDPTPAQGARCHSATGSSSAAVGRTERGICCGAVTNWERGCRVKNNMYFVKIDGSKQC